MKFRDWYMPRPQGRVGRRKPNPDSVALNFFLSTLALLLLRTHRSFRPAHPDFTQTWLDELQAMIHDEIGFPPTLTASQVVETGTLVEALRERVEHWEKKEAEAPAQ